MRANARLSPPNNYKGYFDWGSYVEETASIPAPPSLFTSAKVFPSFRVRHAQSLSLCECKRRISVYAFHAPLAGVKNDASCLLPIFLTDQTSFYSQHNSSLLPISFTNERAFSLVCMNMSFKSIMKELLQTHSSLLCALASQSRRTDTGSVGALLRGMAS